MSQSRPLTSLPPSPQPRVTPRRRRVDPWRRLVRYTPVFELSARLGVNGFLILVAAISLVRLVPHLKGQVEQLEGVQQELTHAEVANSRLRSDFDRYFDPAQADRVIQEQTGYRLRSKRQIVWTD